MKRKWIQNSNIAWTYGFPTSTGLTSDGAIVWLEEKGKYTCVCQNKPSMYVYGIDNLDQAKRTVEEMVD